LREKILRTASVNNPVLVDPTFEIGVRGREEERERENRKFKCRRWVWPNPSPKYIPR
jgi:hypothetical protein